MITLTAEKLPQERSTFRPIVQATRTAATFVALMLTSSLAMPLPQQINMHEPAVISAEYTANLGHNGSISLTWDGNSNMMPQIASNLLRLNEIKALQDNWDDNGAAAFSEEIILKATELVHSLSVQPTILPTARDSIQMEYELENGDYLEFELFESGRLKMFQYTHDGKSETKDISIASANGVILDFYGRKI